jgi:homoserine O-acetyltransferase
MLVRICLIVCCLVGGSVLADLDSSPQQVAEIGDLHLVSGELLHDVRIGYRVAGQLNVDRSNVIVFPTWFGGTSGDLLRWKKIGPGLLADSDQYYVIAIDALGNGVSTSPSNSERQPGADFPAIAIDDMVNAAQALLTRHLGFEHVHAVLGISMGGMQTFQWVWQYPEFMEKAIPIDGSPRATSYDLLQWQIHESAIERMQQGGIANGDVMGFIGMLNLLTLWTPDYFVANVAPEALPQKVAEAAQGSAGTNAYDYLAQLRAMTSHDVYADGIAGGRPYVENIEADLMVVGVPSDHMVNPAPGKALAKSLGARYAEIDSNCGHIGSSCEAWTVNALVKTFLE